MEVLTSPVLQVAQIFSSTDHLLHILMGHSLHLWPEVDDGGGAMGTRIGREKGKEEDSRHRYQVPAISPKLRCIGGQGKCMYTYTVHIAFPIVYYTHLQCTCTYTFKPTTTTGKLEHYMQDYRIDRPILKRNKGKDNGPYPWDSECV